MIDLNSTSIKHIYIIGIGGAGMSAIATVLKKMGKTVSGSDLKSSVVTDRLMESGIGVMIPHSVENINQSIDLVVYSTAIRSDNVELTQAYKFGITVISRADMLAAICVHEKSIGIAGSHGKTTTTSMVTSIARTAGLNPSFMIGGDLNEIGTNAGYNFGSILIVEADESDRTFLDLSLAGAIVTNIENDHLESYNNSIEELIDCFYQFILQVNGPVVMCVDEPNTRLLAQRVKEKRDIITIGENDADWTFRINKVDRGGISAYINQADPLTDAAENILELAVPGVHNIRNALCAYVLMDAFGVDGETCRKGLASFGGVARRFQFRGEINGMTFVDDYAHLPTEIAATLSAARGGKFSRIIVIFQPHRFSRTKVLYEEFAQALYTADIVALCDIYSAGEEPLVGVSSELIARNLEQRGHKNVHRTYHIENVIDFVRQNGRPGDLILTLGAGDVTMYPDIIQSGLQPSVQT